VNSLDLFRNPFSDYNANAMDTKKILDYWCSPFSFFKSPISEQDIYQHDMPIVFMGGRGTGKTMFLKYFSYPVQRDEALRKIASGISGNILSFIKSRGGIGFYLRFDGPVLRSFEGKGLKPEIWDAVFTQYFELQVCKSYIEVILDLVKREQLPRDEIDKEFVVRVSQKLGASAGKCRCIEDILSVVENMLEEITSFRAKIGFSSVQFVPSKPFAAQDLSFGIVEIAIETINEFKDGVKFVIMVDEYENYVERQQVILNTLLKFVTPGITFRIGMRLEGFHTYDTISPKEFIKEGRDYTKFVFEDILIKDQQHGQRYGRFLMNVAQKRLETVQEFRERKFLNISLFLGKRENLEEEACNLIGNEENKTKHFDILSRTELLRTKLDDKAIKNIKRVISKPENPLLEVLNILWIIRGVEPKTIKKAMDEYLEKVSSPLAKKYGLDYVNKYKLSLMILLASIYRKPKMYYSFNTFCFLSSGIVGSFIDLCRRSFQYAYFEDPDTLLGKGLIPNHLQNRAARDMAKTELEMANRIQNYGHNLYLFAKNLGNLFEKYQKDPLMRYPETNQFTIDASIRGDRELDDMFKTALQWSIIQAKPSLQGQTPGASKTDIYTLNRTFSPAFDLTYRTRGAYSEKLDASYFKALMTQDNVKIRFGPRGKKAGGKSVKPKSKEGLQQRLI